MESEQRKNSIRIKQIVLLCISAIFGIVMLTYVGSILHSIIEYNIDSKRIENKYVQTFQQRADDFETINNLLIKATQNDPDYDKSINEYGCRTYSVLDDFSIGRLPLKMSKDDKEALGRIKDIFTYDFSMLIINSERVDYCGIGSEMYVYSRSGKEPEYFYEKDDGVSFSSYEVADNWYYLKAHLR